MKMLQAFLLLSFILLVGCRPDSKNEQSNGSGFFTLTNSPGTVFWGNVQNTTTNDIQFILLLPESDQIGGGNKLRGDASYDYCNLETKRDSHQWKIEANGNLNVGIDSLRLTDLTTNVFVNINLKQSRYWQITDERNLTPLDKVDPLIIKRILHESDAQYKMTHPLP